MTSLTRTRLRVPLAFPLLDRLADWATRRSTVAAIDHLDDRRRIDIGLPPHGDSPLQPSDVAARIAMMAWR
ncbi:DUF1127 domain-containing protein [Rhodobacter sp. SY28-1]|uniref:DUF1127 domain-containing protein n=1 Tax=Rhodobacter sp. SY28-1 TaxID=2562317 RepID=UPI0010C02628|nr:DUF1127 domain-containing protein [Rhodobacter sp. SY28-1]